MKKEKEEKRKKRKTFLTRFRSRCLSYEDSSNNSSRHCAAGNASPRFNARNTTTFGYPPLS